jgi:hypothetical protein
MLPLGVSWMVLLAGLLVVGAFVVVLIVILAVQLGRKKGRAPRASASAEGGDVEQERQAVLKMVADEKVSPEEASELLAALGQPRTPGDRLPLSGGTLASLSAGVLIAAGFVLPWVPVRVGDMHGYQAGHHVGFLGWLVLVLGLLPAVLACIPALDRYLRQGMLRLLLACTGLAFAGSVAVRVVTAGGLPGIGLLLVLVGFGLQLVSALLDTGLLRVPPGTARG